MTRFSAYRELLQPLIEFLAQWGRLPDRQSGMVSTILATPRTRLFHGRPSRRVSGQAVAVPVSEFFPQKRFQLVVQLSKYFRTRSASSIRFSSGPRRCFSPSSDQDYLLPRVWDRKPELRTGSFAKS
jgi:hypothetical protein